MSGNGRAARVFNDYWRLEVESSRKPAGRMQVERKDLTSSEKEPRCGLLLLTVNNAGRHFNYHQSPQINFYSRRTRKHSHVEISLHSQTFLLMESVIRHVLCTQRRAETTAKTQLLWAALWEGGCWEEHFCCCCCCTDLCGSFGRAGAILGKMYSCTLPN